MMPGSGLLYSYGCGCYGQRGMAADFMDGIYDVVYFAAGGDAVGKGGHVQPMP